MEDRSQLIKRYLQDPIVQKRIMENMQRAREDATVTISDAARIYGFKESQLRGWDDLLIPQRQGQIAEQNGKHSFRRQYTLAELNKLAIIRELLKEGKFSIGAIPVFVDEIWSEVAASAKPTGPLQEMGTRKVEHVAIDQRVERTEKDEFWRYFVSQALRLSLLLICEDVPDTVAGIILPLEKENVAEIVQNSDDLPKAGYSLVGWLSESRSFYTFLDTGPTFEHPSDFRVESLANLAEDVSAKQAPLDNILIIVQRKAKPLIFSKEATKTIQRMLDLVYETVDRWRRSFENGARDWMYQVTDFTISSAVSDEVLNGLTDIVVQSGGKMGDGKDRWRFSCILTPEDASLPVSKRTLFVRAQSKRAPHRLAAVSEGVPGLSIRAYQSGQIIYRSAVSSNDFMIAYQDREEFTRSAIAVPLAGENGLTVGVLYVASEEMKAFSEEDERLLRLVGRMIEELLMIYRLRQLPTERLTDMITMPNVVDLSFREFASESDFVNDLEELLKNIQDQGVTPELTGKELSIIAVDIDNLAGIAAKYGDIVARNLSMELGERIQSRTKGWTNSEDRWLYHAGADRLYILLKDTSLDEVRNKAATLKNHLVGDYRFDAQRTFIKRNIVPGALLLLSAVTVRMGVHVYKYEKLEELLERFTPTMAVSSVEEVVVANIEKALKIGQDKGGNVIISWDYGLHDNIVWEPLKNA